MKHFLTRKHANKNSFARFQILSQLLIINKTGISFVSVDVTILELYISIFDTTTVY